jgi:hypothetical protein
LVGEVEIDESFFGKRRFNRYNPDTGQLVKGQTCIIGAIERGTHRVKLQIIPDRERETVERFVRSNIRVGSHTLTDSLWSYNELPYLGYTWDFCNHARGHFGPTNQIENLWSVMKRQLRQVYGTLSFSLTDWNYILNERQIRQNEPDIMYNVDNYLRRVCSGKLQ